jgi:hypothetical protein
MRLQTLVTAAGAVGVIAAGATAGIECRWVEDVGGKEVPLDKPHPVLDISDGRARQIRLQFGVFDDDNGPAPEGGFLGWNMGLLEASGGINRRSPGRLEPFTSATSPLANGNPPLPDGDPFRRLTDIDATIGVQTPFWGFDGDGNPLPLPGPVIYGRNEFISVFAITVQADPANGESYSLVASGQLLSATGWSIIGTPTPPNPDTGEPGFVAYSPMQAPPVEEMDCRLELFVPGPGSAAVLLGAGVGLARRQRRK